MPGSVFACSLRFSSQRLKLEMQAKFQLFFLFVAVGHGACVARGWIGIIDGVDKILLDVDELLEPLSHRVLVLWRWPLLDLWAADAVVDGVFLRLDFDGISLLIVGRLRSQVDLFEISDLVIPIRL